MFLRLTGNKKSCHAIYKPAKNSHLSSFLAARDFLPGETSVHQQHQFHTDDVKSVRNLVRSSDWWMQYYVYIVLAMFMNSSVDEAFK